MKEYLKRLNNRGTILALVSLIALLLIQFGIDVDTEWLNDTINLTCSILVLLGVLNDPTSPGVDLPTKKE